MHLKCPRCSFTYIFCKILSVELTSVKQEDISGSDQEDARFLQPFVVFILSLVILTPPPSPSLSLRATFYAFIDLCLYITHLRHMTNIYYKYEHKKLTSFYECARTLLFPEITCEMFFMYTVLILLCTFANAIYAIIQKSMVLSSLGSAVNGLASWHWCHPQTVHTVTLIYAALICCMHSKCSILRMTALLIGHCVSRLATSCLILCLSPQSIHRFGSH